MHHGKFNGSCLTRTPPVLPSRVRHIVSF